MSLIRFVRKNTLVIVIILFFAIAFAIFTFSFKEGQEGPKNKKKPKGPIISTESQRQLHLAKDQINNNRKKCQRDVCD